MKILIIHNKYGKFSGEEAYVESHINLLRSKGHEVITFYRSSEELKSMSNAKFRAFFSGLYNLNSIKSIRAIIRNEKPDVVHIHNLYPFISPAILPVIKKMGVPIVMTVHNYRLMCPNGLFFTKGVNCEKCTGFGKEFNCITNNCEGSFFKSNGYALRNYWARRKKYYIDNIDSFLCLTKFQRSKLVANGYHSEKCMVLNNFYDRELDELVYDSKEKQYIAYAGRISPEKGISTLLEAARMLPKLSFELAGEIHKGYKDELNIPSNVIFRGMLDRKKLSEFYNNARFFVMPSNCYEGFPMVFLEAMAQKLPIVASKTGGFSEIIEDNVNGLLFETGNINSLVTVIHKLWNDHELLNRLSQNGFEKAQKKYGESLYYKHLEQVYQRHLLKNLQT